MMERFLTDVLVFLQHSDFPLRLLSLLPFLTTRRALDDVSNSPLAIVIRVRG